MRVVIIWASLWFIIGGVVGVLWTYENRVKIRDLEYLCNQDICKPLVEKIVYRTVTSTEPLGTTTASIWDVELLMLQCQDDIVRLNSSVARCSTELTRAVDLTNKATIMVLDEQLLTSQCENNYEALKKECFPTY